MTHLWIGNDCIDKSTLPHQTLQRNPLYLTGMLETGWKTALGRAYGYAHRLRMTDIDDEIPSQTFSIAPEEDTWVREARDWQPCEPKCFVQHVPTRVMFEFYPVPGASPDRPLELEDFEARLAHICEGYPAPPAAELEILGREALLMGLHFIGMVTLLEGPDSLQ